MKKMLLLLLSILFLSACENAKYKSLKAENGVVKIPVSEIDDGDIHYYEVETGGNYVKFFILKSSDGIIRAAFDACDVCYPEKKGYRKEGDFVICNNCDQRFSSKNINILKGGCNPAPLDRKYDDKFVSINLSDIQKGLFYFN